ncbi:hypothetical protein EIP86_002514 [Pleurotus ostreatoroseus]|nr:hypothetical protein EIP86_002514 [Pleurotus ostreatoroseus]
MDRFFTWDLAIKDDHKLITSGPYSVVRHPGYIAAAMIGVGTLLCHFGTGSWFISYGGLETFWGKIFAFAWSSLVVFTPTMLCSRVNVEDEVLHKQFGKIWEDYARRTPYLGDDSLPIGTLADDGVGGRGIFVVVHQVIKDSYE